MARIRYIIIALFSLSQITCLQAQFDNLGFERIGADEGLPNCIITEIVEDRFGFLWLATCEGLFRYDGYEYKAYRHDVSDSTSLSNPYVRSLLQDRDGNLWVGTTNGLNLLDRRTGKFRQFKPSPEDKDTKVLNQVWKMLEDSHGGMWIASNKSAYKFDKQSQQFSKIELKGQAEPDYIVKDLIEDRQGIIWGGARYGLLKLAPGDTGFQLVLPDPNPKSKYNQEIRSFLEEADHTLLLGTEGGLVRWNRKDNTIEKSFLPKDLENLSISQLMKDSKGNTWVSFVNGGMGVYDLKQQKFHYFVYQANKFNGLSSNSIACFTEDRFQNIWVGTDNGLCKIKGNNSGFNLLQNVSGFDDQANYVIRVLQDTKGRIWSKTPKGLFKIEPGAAYGKRIEFPQIPGEYTLGSWFLEDPNGGIWVSVEDNGIYYQTSNNDQFQKLNLGDTLNTAVIYKMVLDSREAGMAWVGTSEGLCKFDLETYHRQWFIPTNDIPDAASNKVSIFEQYGDDEIWLYYTYFNSLGRFDKKTGKFEEFRPSPAKQKVLGGAIKDIVISEDGNIWLATLYGLTNFNIPTKEYNIFNKKDGLAESELNTVILDQKERMWICGHRFLSRFDRQERIFKNYLMSHDVKNFISKSKFLASDGRIYLGSFNGINSFHPDEITTNQEVPNVVLTGFKVKGESYLLEKSYENTDVIMLSHDENDLTFEFSGIHYINPAANEYRCKLEGYDQKWQDLGREHRAVYANLQHGNYVFRVVAANSDGVWNMEGLSIDLSIKPAFWQTAWFKALVFLALLFISIALFRSRQHRLNLQREKELAEQSAEYKTRFLADVSHEIRTPMNAIIGLSKLTLDTQLDEKQTKFIGAIQQSSQNLLTIINDLLDYTKLEAGKFSFVKKPFDLEKVIDQLRNTLYHKAEEKQLDFKLTVSPGIPKKMIGDPLRLNQILINLLGNSLKFTEKGSVWLTIEKIQESAHEVELRFEVGDSGIGIPKDKIESIFDSFSQVNNETSNSTEGTGLGLGIAQQLVEKQGGQLSIESEVGLGTKLWFTLSFAKAESEKRTEQQEKRSFAIDQLRVLVVEDTYFNQMLVVELLKKFIKKLDVAVVENGKMAIEKISQQTFDLILMDVKMPVMDGFEATRIIRKLENETLRNIPILAVTASAISEQIEKCKQAGMDDFVTKPIDEKVLFQKIYSLTQKQ